VSKWVVQVQAAMCDDRYEARLQQFSMRLIELRLNMNSL
jgi:hypothetical protein